MAEGDSGTQDLAFAVLLSPPSEQRVTVEVNTGPAPGDVSAITDFSQPGGPDYQAVTGRTLTFEAGETRKTVNVLVYGDRLDEPRWERFNLQLSNAVNANIETYSAVGYIEDDDPLPRLTVASRTLTEGDTGERNMTFTAALSAATGQEVIFYFDVGGGTATEGEDYRVPFRPRPHQMIISGKRFQTQGTFKVGILGDTLEEGDETFRIELSNPLNVILPDAAITGTITDDDGADPIITANTAPTASDSSVSVLDDILSTPRYTFKAGDFNFADADPGDALASVKIVTPPAIGSLELDGAAVTPNQVVTREQLDAGNVSFQPDSNGRGEGYATFTFRVNDGTAESADSYVMTIHVVAVTYEEVAGLVLVDAATGADLRNLATGPTVSADRSYGVRADVKGRVAVGSVVLSLQGPFAHRHADDQAPYSLFGDVNGVAAGRSFPEGEYTVEAAAHAESGGTGRLLGRVVYRFTVIDAVLPGAPQNPSAGANGRTRIDLQWDPPASDGGSPVTGYRIEVSDDGSTGWSDLEPYHGAVTYSHGGLTSGTTKHYRISAINALGTGAPTDAVSASTLAAPKPATGLAASNPTQTTIGLEWSLPGQPEGVTVTGVEVQRQGADEPWSTVATLAADATAHTVTGLTAGTAYRFRIRLTSRGGNADTDAVSASTLAVTPPQVLGAPTHLRAAGGPEQVTLTWNAPQYDGEITGYEFRFCRVVTPTDCSGERATASGEAGGWTSTDSAAVHTVMVWYTRNGISFRLVNGMRYRFQVRAVARSVTGAATAWVEGVPSAPPAPVDPDGTRDGATRLDANAAARSTQHAAARDSLDTAAGDRVDYYVFTIESQQELGLGVRDQTIDLDAILEDSAGRTVRRSWPPPADPSVEWLLTTLGPGTYYIRVEAAEDGATRYRLRFGLKDPITISVADARAEEGPDASLDFEVTLDRSPGRLVPVSVRYTTVDGTAVAGSDYTATSGTLTFEQGETTKTVSVPVLDDDHDEEEETLTLRLSSASEAGIADGEATGTITNRDPLPKAILARFGRATAVQVVEHVEERLRAPREPGLWGRFAGRELRPGMERDPASGVPRQPGGLAGAHPDGAGLQGALSGVAGDTSLGTPGLTDGGLPSPGPGGDPLTGSAFALNRGTRHGGVLSLWSRSARSSFSGREGALSLGGDVRTTMFGADYAKGPLVAGLSLGHSRGVGEYGGTAGGRVASAVTGLYPWLGYQATDRITVWGVAGYGSGRMLLTPKGAPALNAGLSMAMAAAGTRGELVAGGPGDFGLAFKADVLWVGTSSDGVDGPPGRLAATEAAVTRFRAGLEGSRDYTLGGRLSLRPLVEVGLRHDGGDAETGAGVDIGGGVVAADAETGLAVDVRMRMLVAHQAEGFRDRGVALSFSYDPAPASPLGFSARVAPSWGGEATGGAEALWGREAMASMAHRGLAPGNRLDGEVGYGVLVGRRFVGTPRVGFNSSPHGRDFRVGYGLGVLNRESLRFELGVDAHRRESPMWGGTDHGFRGRVTLGW